MAESAGHLVWIDCEMTGLDIIKDKLIEVAVLITDSELNVLDPGLDLIIGADDADLDGMNEVVADMHAKSGLTDAVRASTLTLAEAEQQLLAYIKRFVPDRRTAPDVPQITRPGSGGTPATSGTTWVAVRTVGRRG